MGYLAIDIGASGGKIFYTDSVINKFEVIEIHRFDHSIIYKNNIRMWDIDHILNEVIVGIKKALLKYDVKSIGIDTWAVDFAVLDENDRLFYPIISYRDTRTRDIESDLHSILSEYELYEKTGIQKQLFNSIYQLYYLKKFAHDIYSRIKTILMIPDYIAFYLTGEKNYEYTNWTTTELLNKDNHEISDEIIEKLELDKQIFGEISNSPRKIGNLKKSIFGEENSHIEVVSVASHDTASAVVSIPSEDENNLFLSSGTWSLLGVETDKPLINRKTFELNYTNEGGVFNTNRLIKNIMGLWILQSLKKEFTKEYSYSELDEMAKRTYTDLRIDCNDARFLAPSSMKREIVNSLKENGIEEELSDDELVSIVYQSLSDTYKITINEIEKITDKKFDALYVVGGGSQAKYLNELINKKTGKNIFAGPTEASGIGNLVMQAIYSKEINSIKEARKRIKETQNIIFIK